MKKWKLEEAVSCKDFIEEIKKPGMEICIMITIEEGYETDGETDFIECHSVPAEIRCLTDWMKKNRYAGWCILEVTVIPRGVVKTMWRKHWDFMEIRKYLGIA